MARAAGGRFLLRIEDIDRARAKPQWEAQLLDDLRWLGITWDGPVLRQSDRLPLYRDALERLWQRGLVYSCTCSRRDIEQAASAPQEGAPLGPDGIVYPGSCRDKGRPRPGQALPETALRLRMDLAATETGFEETGPAHRGWHEIRPETMIRAVGDVVLARREMGTSRHPRCKRGALPTELITRCPALSLRAASTASAILDRISCRSLPDRRACPDRSHSPSCRKADAHGCASDSSAAATGRRRGSNSRAR